MAPHGGGGRGKRKAARGAQPQPAQPPDSQLIYSQQVLLNSDMPGLSLKRKPELPKIWTTFE